MRLGRSRCASAAVAPGIAAQKHYDVALNGLAPDDVFLLIPAYDVARFQPLGFIVGVIHLRDKSRGKSYLVAVAGIAGSGSLGDNALRQFSRKSCRNAFPGIRTARNAHSLIDVSSARKRIAYRAAQAGGGTAERLDFRGVVMRFVFEHNQPLFHLTVIIHVHFHRAGVYLIAHIQIIQLTTRFEFFHRYGGYIHHTYVFIRAGRVVLFIQLFIFVQCYAQMRIVAVYLYIRKLCSKSGVAAMVGPISVYHFQLRKSGNSSFPLEVVAHEF